MIISKFNIGQQVRHKLLGYLGVIIDIDSEYSLIKPSLDDISNNKILRTSPWYHVVMEDDNGRPIHTYLAENLLSKELLPNHPEQPTLDELSKSIKLQLETYYLKN